MKNTVRIAMVALLAITAVGFAIFRVEARTGDGSASRLPSIEERMLGEPPPPGAPASLALTATPAQVDCFTGEASIVTATVTDANGQPVDGDLVAFDAGSMASVNPMFAFTVQGSASSTITPFGYSAAGITVIVGASDSLISEINIACDDLLTTPTPLPDPTPTPDPCADPNSPPSVSPPCATPTTPPDTSPACDRGKPVSPPRGGPPCPKPTHEPPSPPCKGNSNAPRCRPASPPESACADVIGSRAVTIDDAIAIAIKVDKRYNPRFDVDHDGDVDEYDVLETMSQFGRKC